MDGPSDSLRPPANAGAQVVWEYIKGGLDCIMLNNEQGVSYVYYTQLYDAIYNWGTSGRRSGPASGVGPQSPAALKGQELDSRIVGYFRDHTRSLYQSSDLPTNSLDLELYVGLWKMYTSAVNQVNRIFSFHNRSWVKAQRAIKDNPPPTLSVSEVAFVQWRENVFLLRKEEILAALLEAIDHLRSGEERDAESIKTVVDSIATLDIDPNGGKSLLFFKTTLEDQLLTSTTAYYASKKDGASPKEVEKWVGEEKERAERLLPKETAEKVLEAARQALA